MTPQQNAILTAENVTYVYPSKKGVQNISFTVPKGAYVSLIGPNGSGKTTLFQVLCGLASAQKGEIFFDGHNLNRMNIKERARRFAVVHQNENLGFPFTSMETVIFGLHPHRTRFEGITSEQLDLVKYVMELTDTYKLAEQPVTQLSGGERQRVLLARALVQKPQLLFLDEAMSELDVSAKIKMTKLLKELVQQEQLTVFAVHHDVNMAYRFSDLIIALKEGKMAAVGSPHDQMTEAFFAEVFSVQAEVLGAKGFFIHDNLE